MTMNNATQKLYIGVTGFVRREEVLATIEHFERVAPPDRVLMVGVLASDTTLDGRPNKYPRRYPKRQDIAGIFVDHPRVVNLLHFYQPDNYTPIVNLHDYGGDDCDGFQFNGVWPTPKDLKAIHYLRHYDGLGEPRVVLQARPANGAYPVPDAGAYSRLISDVLFDVSAGRGVAISPGDIGAFDLYQARFRSQWGVGGLLTPRLGIAGGLSAEPLCALPPQLLQGISFDAEGRLRDDADGGGNLDLDQVYAYLDAAAWVLAEPARGA